MFFNGDEMGKLGTECDITQATVPYVLYRTLKKRVDLKTLPGKADILKDLEPSRVEEAGQTAKRAPLYTAAACVTEQPTDR